MQLQRGFLGVGVLIALVLGLIVAGGGAYYVVHQQASSQVTSEIPEATPSLNTQVAKQVQTHNNVKVQTDGDSQATTKTSPPSLKPPVKTTPAAVTSKTSAQAQFSVKKVPKYYVFSFFQTERTLELSVTTQPMAADPKTLSLCSTLTDENNVAVTETDCWPLKEYGTWSYMSDGDLSLAPLDVHSAFWTEGLHPVRIRFELVQAPTGDYTSQEMRNRYLLLATDDTGTFTLNLQKDPNPNDSRN